MTEKPLRAATYGRTSSLQQESCDTQLQLCRQRIDERGWKLRYQLKDEGERGGQADRPGYQRLLQLVTEGRIDVIVVWKLDRFCRSLAEASAAEQFLRDHGVAIVSYTEPFDTTQPIGRFVFGFLANMAQFETELIRERAHLGYERRVKAGKWTGPHPPYGYTKDGHGKLRIDHAEAQLIRVLHRNYAHLGGDAQLARWMNQKGRRRRDRNWTTNQVRRALTDPTTTGLLTQRGSSSSHPELAIVSAARFRKTQAQRDALRHDGKHKPAGRDEEALDAILEAYLGDLSETQIVADMGGLLD